MKSLIYSLLTVFGVLATVIIISLLLSQTLREIEDKLDAYSVDPSADYGEISEDFKLLRDEFQDKLPMLSLLISDNELIGIEQSFSDVICYANAESLDGVISSIGRLRVSLEHLREMSGLTLKSIF